MKQRSEAVIKKWNLPDWRDASLYPVPLLEKNDSDLFQWKWEFLRRCDEYQQDWIRFRQLKHPFQLALLKDPSSDGFDLPKYPKEYRERHGDVWYVLERYKLARLLNPAIASPKFLCFYPIPDDGVLVWFDLQRSLKEEIRHARKLLDWHQRGVRRNKLRRKRLPPKKEWPTYLRVLDAYHTGETFATIGYDILKVNPKNHGPERAGNNAESKLRTASAMWKNIPIPLSLPPMGFELIPEKYIDDLVPPGYRRKVLPRI